MENLQRRNTFAYPSRKRFIIGIARNLLADGIPAEQVARWTGLSEEEIAKLTR